MAKRVPPYFKVDYEPADVTAVQALARGDADGQQQRRALDWIIRQACSTYDVTFHPGEPDASAFAAGRRYPGQKIVELLGVSVPDLIKRQQRINRNDA